MTAARSLENGQSPARCLNFYHKSTWQECERCHEGVRKNDRAFRAHLIAKGLIRPDGESPKRPRIPLDSAPVMTLRPDEKAHFEWWARTVGLRLSKEDPNVNLFNNMAELHKLWNYDPTADPTFEADEDVYDLDWGWA